MKELAFEKNAQLANYAIMGQRGIATLLLERLHIVREYWCVLLLQIAE